MKSVGIVANLLKPEAPEVLTRIARQAKALGIRLLCSTPAEAHHLQAAKVVPEARLARQVDALIALGGDGTMLKAVRVLGDADTPVLGVNLGNLGFLTSVTMSQLERALEVLVRGQFSLSKRTLLECRLLRGGRTIGRYRGLNDVVVGWGHSSRINTFNVSVNGEHVTSYRCDGILVSTPTGTTGHSLSAGGPILHPATPALLLTVMCPHTLSTRPLVIPDNSRIAIDVTETSKKLLLSVDGQEGEHVIKGDRLELAKAASSIRFIQLPGYSYFSVLSQKLNWRGSSVT